MGSTRQRLEQLRRHPVPTSWRDGKLGIFVHWTPASVPAFAPTDAEIGDLLASGDPQALSRVPYTEWYENSLRFADSPAARHHAATYGDRPYAAFATDWEAGLTEWDPDDWAARFAATGASHVVFVAKHCDGYCLWPTAVPNPTRPGWHSRRDVVGELAEAVRGVGLRFGIYYCGGWDWTFEDQPIGSMADVPAAIPGGDYPAYADAHLRELIERYRPSVLWNDVAWPAPGRDLWRLLGDYYEAVPDGMVNDRWMPFNPSLARAVRSEPVRRLLNRTSRRRAQDHGGMVPPKPPHFDVRTPEYTGFDHIDLTPWECVRGMDRSFGYNAQSGPDDFIAPDDLLWLLVDSVAKGGNLLLNVGPRGVDAQIPEEQTTRLDHLAGWLPADRDAVVATRPWIHAGDTTAEGHPIRYTARDQTVFAFLRGASGPVTLTEVGATPTTTVATLDGTPLSWRAEPGGLTVDLPDEPTESGPVVLALGDVTARPAASRR